MHRLTILALLLVPLLVAVAPAQANSPAAPVIHFSFYAPPQKDPPVHIVAFENDQSDIQLVLSNVSDKPVVGAIVRLVYIAPSECGLEPQRDDYMAFESVGGVGYELRIVPHGEAVASRVGIFRLDEEPPQAASYARLTGTTPQGAIYPHYPKTAVFRARDAKAGYMQVQFGIIDVFFEDGSTWPAQISDGYHPDPFDRKLVEAEAGKCTDVATVAKAVQSVEKVVVEKENPATSGKIPGKSDDEGAPPHLRFSCSLEGSKAVCRLPPEDAHTPHKPVSQQAPESD
jgi:hypothetical protein